MRVLVIEDHVELADDIADGLRDRGIATDVAYDGASGLQKGLVNRYDVIVLDRDVPQLHGDEVCTALGDGDSAARIVMLTAAAGIRERVEGLNLGADDYLPKPFAFDELVARLHALARRGPTGSPVLLRGELELDRAQRRAVRSGTELALTRKELGVLEELMLADGAGAAQPRRRLDLGGYATKQRHRRARARQHRPGDCGTAAARPVRAIRPR